ncbi:hypothetical protein ACH4VR_19495 [Streptomyces sp. NPDC020883]|uniref:hypothetical protein n=1 Tax=Streptomyces sp. NPDC020883 TaxID=3365099 RepID=UPI00378F2C5E
MSQLAEGEWNLAYYSDGLNPGADFTFGSFRSGYYLLEPFEIKYGDSDVGDVPLPREDGVRLGQDYRAGATLTFEVGVDTVDRASTSARHDANLDAVSVMTQAWDAESLRGRFGKPAVLRTRQGGRARCFYGRPRKCEPSSSKLTRQGYTPVIATFASVDGTAYDDVEQNIRVGMAPPPHHGLIGPLTSPLTMTGECATKVPGEIIVGGTKPAWPIITIFGPVTQPACELVGYWKVTLDLTLAAGERVAIDTRPWGRTVLRNGHASVAGLLTRDSPTLKNMRLPIGRRDLVLRGKDPTATAYMIVAWRDAYTYL